MSFQDDMIEEGFSNEEDYLEYITNETEERMARSSTEDDYEEDLDYLQIKEEERQEQLERARQRRRNKEEADATFYNWKQNNPDLAEIWKLRSGPIWIPYQDLDGMWSSYHHDLPESTAGIIWAKQHIINQEKYSQIFTEDIKEDILDRWKVDLYSSLFCRYIIPDSKVSEYASILREWLKEDDSRMVFLREMSFFKEKDNSFIDSVIWDEHFNEGNDLFYYNCFNPGKYDSLNNSITDEDLSSAYENWIYWNKGSNYISFLRKHNKFWTDEYAKRQKEIDDERAKRQKEIDQKHETHSNLLAIDFSDPSNDFLREIEEEVRKLNEEFDDIERKMLEEEPKLFEIDYDDDSYDFLDIRRTSKEKEVTPDQHANKALFDLWKKEEPEQWEEWKKDYILYKLLGCQDFLIMKHKDNETDEDDRGYGDDRGDDDLYIDCIFREKSFKKKVSSIWISSHINEWKEYLSTINYEVYKDDILLASALEKWLSCMIFYDMLNFPWICAKLFLSFADYYLQKKPECMNSVKELQSEEYEKYIEQYYNSRASSIIETNDVVKKYVDDIFIIYLAEKYDLIPCDFDMKQCCDLY